MHLNLKPYKQASVALRKNIKLNLKFCGPRKTIQRIGLVVYKLQPGRAAIHPMLHWMSLSSLPRVDEFGRIKVSGGGGGGNQRNSNCP